MHIDFYKKNQRYTELLRDSDPRQFQSLPPLCQAQSFHEKYEQALRAAKAPGSVILDVGCGVGQVVRSLAEAGFQAHGVEVSEANIAQARQHPGQFHAYDGCVLPFPDHAVDAVGAFNVLEHVENPVALLDEMTRVLRPGGRMVISSPNFFRVFGWRDYHPHMTGFFQKWRNAKTLYRHSRIYATDPDALIFEKMTPIEREIFQCDDDAIVATNAVDFRQYLRTRNYKKIHISCVDRPVPRWLEATLDFTPLRFLILNSFITAEKPGT
ncbi:MAG TPA: class I SAM-dependent methyltransferase [Candidatus Methylacidiphilales bacterium]